jgi:hypothetical protein
MAQSVNEIGALSIALAERTNQVLAQAEKIAELEVKVRELEDRLKEKEGG